MTSAVILTSAIQEAVEHKVSFPQNLFQCFSLLTIYLRFGYDNCCCFFFISFRNEWKN